MESTLPALSLVPGCDVSLEGHFITCVELDEVIDYSRLHTCSRAAVRRVFTQRDCAVFEDRHASREDDYDKFGLLPAYTSLLIDLSDEKEEGAAGVGESVQGEEEASGTMNAVVLAGTAPSVQPPPGRLSTASTALQRILTFLPRWRKKKRSQCGGRKAREDGDQLIGYHLFKAAMFVTSRSIPAEEYEYGQQGRECPNTGNGIYWRTGWSSTFTIRKLPSNQ